MLPGIGFAGNVYLAVVSALSHDIPHHYTYIIILIFWKQGKEFIQEQNQLISHFLQFMYVAVGIHIAEAGAHRIINEQDVGEFIP